MKNSETFESDTKSKEGVGWSKVYDLEYTYLSDTERGV